MFTTETKAKDELTYCDDTEAFFRLLEHVALVARSDEDCGRKLYLSPNGVEAARAILCRATSLPGHRIDVTCQLTHLKAVTAIYNAARTSQKIINKVIAAESAANANKKA